MKNPSALEMPDEICTEEFVKSIGQFWAITITQRNNFYKDIFVFAYGISP